MLKLKSWYIINYSFILVYFDFGIIIFNLVRHMIKSVTTQNQYFKVH